MTEAIYLLCAVASIACAALLLRGYMASRVRLLLWSGLCFAGYAVNNLLLVFAPVLSPGWTEMPVREAVALVSTGLLVFGLVWESE
ncbi:DUF5985 family protein [Archangium primigenium]|uniref:DUF5985 family protein n=1 Tax=[Archangium] primigenium TaxID=2792470 RepID=UPI00195AFA64|nr:hypothetical protein [Archangium primigenium]